MTKRATSPGAKPGREARHVAGHEVGSGAGSGASVGRFITFEGGEGAGKSTQIQHLAKRLEALGIACVTTREPGGSSFAEAVRLVLLSPDTAPQSAMAQTLAFYAARADHLAAMILPALARGAWVLCDRFADSTRAYQGVAGGVAAQDVEALDGMVVGATQPELTVLLDLDPVVGLQRASARRGAGEMDASAGVSVAADSFESQALVFHQRLRAGFLDIAKAQPDRVVVIDASQGEPVIADAVWRAVAERFQLAAPGASPTPADRVR